MRRLVLTDRAVAALPPAPAGARVFIADVIVPNFGVRLSGKSKSYVLRGRFRSKNPTFRAIGEVGALSLADARAIAREWILSVKQGRDPKCKQPNRDHSFSAIAEEFIKRRLPGQRKGARTAHEIRRELVRVWGSLSIGEITRRDVVELIERIADRPAPAYARNIFGHIRVLYDWAINRGL